jgi:hypothetical protein
MTRRGDTESLLLPTAVNAIVKIEIVNIDVWLTSSECRCVIERERREERR